MVNFKRMDDKDFVFLNKPQTAKADKEFSDFLKVRKSKLKRKRVLKKETALSKLVTSTKVG